jgi:hypothetical protein
MALNARTSLANENSKFLITAAFSNITPADPYFYANYYIGLDVIPSFKIQISTITTEVKFQKIDREDGTVITETEMGYLIPVLGSQATNPEPSPICLDIMFTICCDTITISAQDAYSTNNFVLTTPNFTGGNILSHQCRLISQVNQINFDAGMITVVYYRSTYGFDPLCTSKPKFNLSGNWNSSNNSEITAALVIAVISMVLVIIFLVWFLVNRNAVMASWTRMKAALALKGIQVD